MKVFFSERVFCFQKNIFQGSEHPVFILVDSFLKDTKKYKNKKYQENSVLGNLALSILQRLFSGSLPLMKQCISILEEKKTQATYFQNILEENKSEIQTNKDTNTQMKRHIKVIIRFLKPG